MTDLGSADLLAFCSRTTGKSHVAKHIQVDSKLHRSNDSVEDYRPSCQNLHVEVENILHANIA